MHRTPIRSLLTPLPHLSTRSPSAAARPAALARRRRLAALLLGLALCFGAALPAGIASGVPIGDLHANDPDGTPTAPYDINTVVTVSGVVTVPDSVFNFISTAVHVQDATGGIYIFQSGGVSLYDFVLGDSVSVTGQIAHFQGITEITNLTNVTVHSQGNPLPEPLVVTCADVEATFDPGTFREDNESKLVRIQDVSIVSGSWPTVPTGNTILTIDDGTATTTLYIDKDSELNGSPAPPAVFDITGVIQQADGSSPFTSGYRLLPRFASDIGGSGPQITSGPTITELTPTSVRVEWTTSVPANSTLELGPTTTYGQSFHDPALVTEHSVLASPIDDASYWHARVRSSDGGGTASSADFTFFTEPATDEALMVFFNQSIDPTYAAAKVAAGDVSFSDYLVDYIDAAQFSLDAAFYSISLPEIADALIAAHNRGVEVRVIKDADTSDVQFNVMLANGVPGIKSDFGGPRDGIHHNKFWVRDARDGSSTLDDWVITGSWNPTFQGTDSDAQNIVVIKDTEMAAAYTIEFDEMWGSTTTVPDAANSRFSTDKFNNTQHQFDVGGIPVDLYFAPSDGHESVMLFWINNAHTSLYFSILTFTRDQIQSTMRNRRTAVPGLEVRGVFDDGYDGFSEYPVMAGIGGANPWSPPADVHLGNYSPGFLHHKYLIIDSNDPTSDPSVITGSPNWSSAARNDNDENQITIHDYDISRQFLQEFAVVYTTAGGTEPLGQSTGLADPAPAPGPAGSRFGLRNTPNPFNPQTTIHFDLQQRADAPVLRIYDPHGRAVRHFALPESMAAGEYAVDWDGTGDDGQPMASGVYFYRLESGGVMETERMVLAR